MQAVKSNLSTSQPRSPRTGFRRYLQDELARRCLDNAQYSLRAFAGRLGVDHSTLSQILRGRRALTERMIRRLAERLDLPAEDVSAFVARQRELGVETPAQRQVRHLTRDVLNVISDWHHYAILELCRLEGFRSDSRWIARALGITPDEVNAALSRLVRLRLLEMVAADRWVDRSGNTRASFADFSQAAMQRFSEQVRQLSLAALGSPATERALVSSATVAVHASRAGEVRRRIERFRAELEVLLEQDDRRHELYQLELNFFPITHLDPERPEPGEDQPKLHAQGDPS